MAHLQMPVNEYATISFLTKDPPNHPMGSDGE